MEYQLKDIDQNKTPEHLAIIMDGNGRWATLKGLDRSRGHREGKERAKEVTDLALKLGIKYLTLYVFSTENWERPKDEVNSIIGLFEETVNEKLAYYLKYKGINLHIVGDTDRFPDELKKKMNSVLNAPEEDGVMTLTLAVGYGGRHEIISATQSVADLVAKGVLSPNEITEYVFEQHLYTKDIPDVDLLIRTGGEERISNFLLWRLAYAEIYFTSVLWPDFKAKNLHEAILDYQLRKRNFGKIK